MIGLDLLGFAHKRFPWKNCIKQLPEGWAIGVFDDPFGPVLPRLRKALRIKHIPAVRIQAHWANNHTYVPLPKLRKKLPAYEKLALEFPQTQIYVSHSCEYDSTDKRGIKERCDLIRELAPHCIPVNSRLRGSTLPDVITESHGKNCKAQPREIVSMDGDNIYDIDAEGWVKANSQAAITFLWGYRFNLREINDPHETVPPPSERKAKPSPTYTKSIIRLGTPKGMPPSLSGVKPLPAKAIYKTHAEDEQGVETSRENRPVLLLPLHASSVTIQDKNGARLGKLIRSGPDFNGMARYYSGLSGGIGLYGVEIAEKAAKYSGSEWVCFKVGKHLFGPIHPAFRAGNFR